MILMNLNSLIESIIDVGSGFLLAIAIQVFIFPFFGLYPSILDSIGIALIFTVISMLRSWVWRSYFKRRHEN
jgi:Na+-driven multidrug efflux pump